MGCAPECEGGWGLDTIAHFGIRVSTLVSSSDSCPAGIEVGMGFQMDQNLAEESATQLGVGVRRGGV